MDTKFLAFLLVLFGGVSYAASGFLGLFVAASTALVEALPLGSYTLFSIIRTDPVSLEVLAGFSILEIVTSYVVLRHAKLMSRPNAVFSRAAVSMTVGAAFVGLASSILAGSAGQGVQTNFIYSYYFFSPSVTLVPYSLIAIVTGVYVFEWSDRTSEEGTANLPSKLK
jgi:hypothetical protein